MRVKALLALLAVMGLTTACNTINEGDLPSDLSSAVTTVSASLDSLSGSLSAAAVGLAQSGADTLLVRAEIQRLFRECSFGSEFVFTTPGGVLQLVEPEVYYSSQGSDISRQAHIVKAFDTWLPVLSDVFSVVEGYQAVVEIHPIVADGQLLGGISGLYFPASLIARCVVPIVGQEPFRIWVMEKSGTVLYDADPTLIGLNVFTDKVFEQFPEMRPACERMTAGPFGKTSFPYTDNVSGNIVPTNVFWKTLLHQGNEWIFIRTQAKK